MVQSCGPAFEKHRQVVIDRAVSGGVVCPMDEPALRIFLKDMTVHLKPQQDTIIGALEDLRRRTEMALAEVEKSGSPYTFAVVRALRSHHLAYVTFTKAREARSVIPLARQEGDETRPRPYGAMDSPASTVATAGHTALSTHTVRLPSNMTRSRRPIWKAPSPTSREASRYRYEPTHIRLVKIGCLIAPQGTARR